ncbi:hypothetical protein VYU27_009295 [Nannochloropsis oceanica]
MTTINRSSSCSSSSSVGVGGHMHATDSSSPSFNKPTLPSQTQLASANAPMSSQQEAYLPEIQSYAHSNLPFMTTTPETPASARRPLAQYLEEKGLIAPGVARATQAASVEKPFGSAPEGPNYKKMGTPLRSVMQQHVDFFDRDGDGVITMRDTFFGFRRLGFNWAFCLWAVFVINPAFSIASYPGYFIDPFMCIYSRNIHRGKHGSDQEVYDHEGRFIPQRFEDIFAKWDQEGKGGLSLRDLWKMTQSSFEVNDFFGWFAGKFEWFTLWLLTADDKGLVTKEAVRSVYDGSLFYKMEAKWGHGAPASELGEYANMGEGSTFSALWARLRGGQKGREKAVTEQVTMEGKSKRQNPRGSLWHRRLLEDLYALTTTMVRRDATAGRVSPTASPKSYSRKGKKSMASAAGSPTSTAPSSPTSSTSSISSSSSSSSSIVDSTSTESNTPKGVINTDERATMETQGQTPTPAYILKYAPYVDNFNWLMVFPLYALAPALFLLQCYYNYWLPWYAMLLLPFYGYARNIVCFGLMHRFFSHRAWQCSRPTAFVLGCMATLIGNRGPLWW